MIIDKRRNLRNFFSFLPLLDAPIRSFFGTSLQDHVDKDGYSVVLKLCLDYLMKNQGYSHEVSLHLFLKVNANYTGAYPTPFESIISYRIMDFAITCNISYTAR